MNFVSPVTIQSTVVYLSSICSLNGLMGTTNLDSVYSLSNHHSYLAMRQTIWRLSLCQSRWTMIRIVYLTIIYVARTPCILKSHTDAYLRGYVKHAASESGVSLTLTSYRFLTGCAESSPILSADGRVTMVRTKTVFYCQYNHEFCQK